MGKSEKPTKVEIQKGPINMQAQMTNKFMGRPACTMQDIAWNEGRRKCQTMDLHEPKR